MSNRRPLVVLILLLLALAAAHLWMDVSSPDKIEVLRRRSLFRPSDTATAYEISGPGRPTLRLEKSDCWRITQPFRAVADQSGVARLSDALAFAPVIDSLDASDVVRLGRTDEDFGLETPRLKLAVETPSGRSLLAFGGTLKSDEGVYAAVEGVPAVYIVPKDVFAVAGQSVDSWRRRSVFRLTADEVTAIDIRRGETPAMRLQRKDEGWDIVEPRRAIASAAAVNRMIETLLACEARTFLWPVGASNETVSASVSLLSGFGLDPETCETVVFRTGDGQDHAISFGSVADSESVYALIQGGSAVATVAAAARDSVSMDVGALVEGRIFPLEKSAVQRVSLQEGETAYLLARDDNGQWRLDSPVSAAADEAAVTALIDKLLVMRSGDLDEHGVKVSLVTNLAAVSVSRAALFGDAGFEQLRSKTMLDVDPVTVKRLVVSSVDGRKSSVVYDPDRKGWNIESSDGSGSVNTARVTAFLAALSPLKATSVVRLKVLPGELVRYGLENPALMIAVDRLIEGSVRRNILIGNRINDKGDAYATIGSSDAVFVLDGKTVATLSGGVLDE